MGILVLSSLAAQQNFDNGQKSAAVPFETCDIWKCRRRGAGAEYWSSNHRFEFSAKRNSWQKIYELFCSGNARATVSSNNLDLC